MLRCAAVQEAARAISQERAPPDSWLSEVQCPGYDSAFGPAEQLLFQTWKHKLKHIITGLYEV